MISDTYSLVSPENAPQELYATTDQKQQKNLINQEQSATQKLNDLRASYLN